MQYKTLKTFLFIIFSFSTVTVFSQFRAKEIYWTPDGTAYLKISNDGIVKTDVATNNETLVVKNEQLIPAGTSEPLPFGIYSFSTYNQSLLIFKNTSKDSQY